MQNDANRVVDARLKPMMFCAPNASVEKIGDSMLAEKLISPSLVTLYLLGASIAKRLAIVRALNQDDLVALAHQAMVLEVAILDVIPEQTTEFEGAFAQAQSIIVTMAGYISHELQKCIEKPNRYILLVKWRSLEDHTRGFRASAAYQDWKALLHHYYDPFPVVEHYQSIA